MQSETGHQLLDEFDLTKSDFDTFILIIGDSVYTKSTATLKIVKDIFGPLKILSVFIFLPEFFRDWIYGLIVKNRYRFFGIRDVCRVPDKEEKKKFL